MGEAKTKDRALERLAELKQNIRDEYDAMQLCLKDAADKMSEAVSHAIETGRWLTETHDTCKTARKKWGEFLEESQAELGFGQETANLYMRFYKHRDVISAAVQEAEEPLSMRELREKLPKAAPRGRAGGRAGTGAQEQQTTAEPSHSTTPTPGAGTIKPQMPLQEGVKIMEEDGVEFSNTVTNPGANGNSDPNLKVDALPIETELLAQAQTIIDLIKANATLQEIVKYISAHDMKLRMAVNE